MVIIRVATRHFCGWCDSTTYRKAITIQELDENTRSSCMLFVHLFSAVTLETCGCLYVACRPNLHHSQICFAHDTCL